ncbi:MAG: peptidoglycan DD-metalloendopeptidase family protein [Lysobacterales bacterium]
MVRPAPSVDQGERPTYEAGSASTEAGPSYTVQAGDTLYKISVQYGVDYRDLARWNNISPPYTIYPKQTLRVGSNAAPAVAASAPAATAAPTSSTTVSASTQRPPAGSDRVGAAAVASAAQPAPGYDANLGVTLPEGAEPISGSSSPPSAPVFEPEVPTAAAAATASAATSSAVQPATSSAAAAITPTAPAAAPSAPAAAARPSAAGWIWPTSGKVVVTYASGDPTRQGIDIVGELGQPVVAARDGEVVYSGAGLIGYGELVIVKHSPELLSAYGHNRTRLVKEGDKVKAGQKIAEMGKSSSNRVLLHFEVRKNGKPVDPMPLLPAR